MASHPSTVSPTATDVQASTARDAGQPLAGRRHRRREGDPGQDRRRPRTSTTPTSSASSTSTRARPASTCRASRRSSPRRSTRSCSARRFKAEVLAAHIAQHVRERQGGLRAEVSVTARYPQTVTTPESGMQTQEIYVLFGTAVASERGTRTLTGVQAQGMTACPCAQEMVAGVARERLAEQRLRRRAGRGARSRRCRSRPTTSAGSAPSTSAARRAARAGSTPPSCCGSSRAR